MTTYNSLQSVFQGIYSDHNDNELRTQMIDFIINGNIDGAKQFINNYIKIHRDDPTCYDKFALALSGLPQQYSSEKNFNTSNMINRYILSSLCIIGNSSAIEKLGMLYEGIDGDEMDKMGITEANITTSLSLFNQVGSLTGCLEIVFICTEGNKRYHYFDEYYPKECINNMIKTNLAKAFKLYDKPISDPNYQNDIGYIFDYVPGEIIKELINEDNTFAKYVPATYKF